MYIESLTATDMEDAIGGAAAQGDLADVVARAGAMAPPPSFSAADHISSSAAMAGQIVMNHPYEEDRRLAVMFEPPSTVDPYLSSSSSSMTAPRGGYWQLPPQQVAAAQISQHACYGRDMVMSGATADVVEGDDATRTSSPVMPAAAAHQMMKRKNDVKKVVCIPAPPATSSRPGGGGDVIPSDLWAWRKYGQKPIKGSPYPRGYYRCSSSKGCMAKKQVERSRSDPNMLVITYTAEHNHPWPMQRNVLAGYSRPHTHVPTNCKKNSCRVDPTNSMSPSSSKNDLEYQHSTNVMESNAAAAFGACPIGALSSEGVMPSSCNGIQPAADEVFAELEELEPSNNPVDANVYSRGVDYEWNKL